MVVIYDNPTLLDFVFATIQMPEGERRAFEALTGHKYDVDGIAIGNYGVTGPKWVMKNDEGKVLSVGGFALQRPGVYRDFQINSPEAFSDKANWLPLTRFCRKAIDWMLDSKQAHRIECVTPASRGPDVLRWYRTLGYYFEGTIYGYCANGEDALMYCKVKH